MHATIPFQYSAQNVKVNLGHNFQIRGKEKRERERERDSDLVRLERIERDFESDVVHCPCRIIVCRNALILQNVG